MYVFHWNFSSYSESAEIRHADCFCVKRYHVFFSWEGRKLCIILHKNPPSLGVVVGGGGGVWVDFQERIWSLVCPLVEQKTGKCFNIKRVGTPNFSGFQVTWKFATKYVHAPFLDFLINCPHQNKIKNVMQTLLEDTWQHYSWILTH